METANNIIKNKIDSVTDLPEGYTPNLNSKWELLQAGLPQQPEKKQRKPVMFYMQRAAAVAAMLLMIGGSGLLLIKKPNTAKPHAQATAKPDQQLAKQQVLPSAKTIQVAAVKSTHVENKPTKINQQPIIIDSVIQAPSPIITPEPTPQPMLAQAEPLPIITEVDFTEPVLKSTTPTDVLVKAQRFKFKLGIGETQGLNAATNKPNTIGLRTSF